MPPVRRSDGHILDWDRNRIVRQILTETRLVEIFYDGEAASEETARMIAREVEDRIRRLGLASLSGPLIREIMNIVLLEHGMVRYRNVLTRVGTPVYDAHLIDVGRGFESHDNANLQENAETSHKKKADKISKEQYLLQLPPEIADHHLTGDLHVHDLEYFGTRPFCLDGATVVPARTEGRTRMLRLDELPFEDDDLFVPGLEVLTPTGFRRMLKATRRPIGDEPVLGIRTANGRSIRVTREHRVPVERNGGMAVVPAGELAIGDRLYVAGEGTDLRGGPVESIDLAAALVSTAPEAALSGVMVRGLRPVFEGLAARGETFAGISRAIGIEHHQHYYTRGILPLAAFARLRERYGVGLEGLELGVGGSRHTLPAELPVTPALVRLLGLFVAEGHYDTVPGSCYNLGITGGVHAATVTSDATAVFQSYATTSGGAVASTSIYGVPITRPRATQVLFGGKLAWLLVRYAMGIPEGAANKRLPSLVWDLSDDLLAEFLSALFAGDGSAFYRPEKSDCIVTYTTASPTLRQELSFLLGAIGCAPQVVELYADDAERTTLYRLQVHGAARIARLARFVRFPDERQVHLDRFLDRVRPISRRERGERIASIGEVPPSGPYVYDLFLEGDGTEASHCFYASDGLLVHNCQDWDLRYFLYYGLMPDGNGTKASVAGPAKRAEVAVLHAVKALGSAQTNFAGGQGYYNFLTFLAPYIEGMPYEEIKQLMQMFVYEMTQMMVARGGQLVFSSVQLSPGVPALWKDKPCVYKGKVWDGEQAPLRTYGEFEREVRLLFLALMDVMLEGDSWGKPFNFPKPEISIEPDFMTEDEAWNAAHPDLPTYRALYLKSFELASKFGTPYYDNQLPAYRGAGKGISCYQCCAYQFSALAENDSGFEDKLYFREGRHFSMGSWQVVSINCPRAAFNAEGSDERLFAELKALMDKAVETFRIKRRWMNIIRTNGRMPFAMQRPKDPMTGDRGAVAVDLDPLVYTIGVVGVNEMVQHHCGSQLHETREAFRLAIRAMTELELYARELSNRHGMTIALARTPAETTGQRFAVADLLDRRYREYAKRVIKGDLDDALSRLGSTNDLPVYYTNGTHVAPGAPVPLTKRMEIEHVFFPIVDGGNIFHIWLGERRPDPRGLMEMAFNLCRKTQIGYFAFTRDLTVGLRQFRERLPEPRQEGINSVDARVQA
jgi:ribonucleoside-triphosphate reductase